MAETPPNTPKTSRTLAIGDIHGCLLAFETILEKIKLTKDDTLILLGDYVDRGPDSKGVIDKILELKEKYNVIALKGNHEEIMELGQYSAAGLMWWQAVGGEATLMSFDCCIEDIEDKYWDFIESLPLYHETKDFIYVHAGLKPDLDLEDQDEDTLLWLRFRDLKAHKSGKRIVCGHTPQRETHIPSSLPHGICIDTHVYNNQGYLTCLDMDTGICYQASRCGEFRKRQIEL